MGGCGRCQLYERRKAVPWLWRMRCTKPHHVPRRPLEPVVKQGALRSQKIARATRPPFVSEVVLSDWLAHYLFTCSSVCGRERGSLCAAVSWCWGSNYDEPSVQYRRHLLRSLGSRWLSQCFSFKRRQLSDPCHKNARLRKLCFARTHLRTRHFRT